MPYKTICLFGQVLHRRTREGMAGLRVEAWAKDPTYREACCGVLTDERGSYRLEIHESRVRELQARRGRLLFFQVPKLFARLPSGLVLKVIRDGEVIESLEIMAGWDREVEVKEISIWVDVPDGKEPPPNGSPQPFIVQGHVRQADTNPLGGAIIRAVDKDLRHEELLGVAETDRTGQYKITYTSAQFHRAEKGTADLIVRAFFPGSDQPVVASPVVFNAPPVATIDLMVGGGVYQGPSEYEQLETGLMPLLEGVQPADLTEDDVSFLQGETGLVAERIAFFVVAARLAKETGLPPAVFYGFARENLPTVLPALLAQTPAVLRRALQSALGDNIIPARLRPALDDVLSRLQRLVVESAFRNPAIPGKFSLGVLLQTAVPEADRQHTFLDLYLQNKGTVEEFWQGLRQRPDFAGPGVVEQLQFTLQLGALTQNHLPLVQELQAQHSNGTLSGVRDLAKLEAADWRTLINKQVNGQPIGFPPDIPGTTDNEKAANYAAILAGIIQDAFPTAVIASRMARDQVHPLPGREDLGAFLDGNPDFDLRTTNIDKYLADHPGALVNVAKPDEMLPRLRGVQRVLKLTPEYGAMSVLVRDGLDSAQRIARFGRNRFVETYASPLGGRAGAAAVYDRADQMTARVLAVYNRYSTRLNGLNTYVTHNVADLAAAVGNYETLFGSLSYCTCEDCQSVTSPAAYLVDLLHFLQRHEPTPLMLQGNPNLQKPLDVLLGTDQSAGRRPDLRVLKLSCANTNTPLPYIDLVNEILEEAVAPGGPSRGSTDGTPDELSINPQYLNPNAYSTLARVEARYPWDLPFNLWLSSARIYLGQLGIRRSELMETFQNPAAPDPTVEAIAGEYLGLSTQQRQIITGAATPPGTPPPVWLFWGLQQPTVNGVPWNAYLSQVAVFLRQSGLTFDQLTTLLDCKFITGNGSPITIQPPESCDLQELRLKSAEDDLPGDAFDRIHRFVRLWRILGWTLQELDKAIRAFAATDLTDVLLVKLSHVQRLRQDFNLPVVNILAWWAPLDTVDTPNGEISLYNRLFQNKAVVNPVDEAFLLTGTPLEPKKKDDALFDHSATLTAALNLSKADLLLLANQAASIAQLQLPPEFPDVAQPGVTAAKLTVENLTHLYRLASLSRALGLKVRELLAMRALTAVDPFNAADTAGTLLFIDQVRAVQNSGFSITELTYLLRHAPQPQPGVDPVLAMLRLFRTETEAGLQKIAADNRPVEDPTGAVTRGKLAVLLPQDQVNMAMGLLGGVWNDTDANRQSFLRSAFKDFLDKPALDQAVATLIPGSLTADQKRDHINFVLIPLLAYLQKTLSQNFVLKKVAETFQLDTVVATALVSALLKAPSDPTQGCLVDLLAIANGDPPPDRVRANFDQAALLLSKAAMLLNRLRLGRAWLPVFGKPAVGGLFDLDRLPTSPTGPAPALFGDWETLIRLVNLRSGLPRGEDALLQVLAAAAHAADEPTLLGKIADLTGWALQDLKDVVLTQGLGFAFPDDYKRGTALARLQACFAALARLGASPANAHDWTRPDLQPQDAADIKKAVKAKYDVSQWQLVAKPLQDALRERQRAALVSFLVGNRGFADSDDLFGHYLIDVEMSPCQLTSRLKQAISSVQLFIQRCFLNLEQQPPVALDTEAADEWKWRKSYRVWEANRKVFLYPENWIEPELRDDKTPFFEDLENELLQSDITADTVETVYLHYLEKLDEVSRLELCGFYHESEDPSEENPKGREILHVFGRTRDTTHLYYYRQLTSPNGRFSADGRASHNAWSPWRKVDLDIEGDHLIPVVYERRLYLFWPVFTEKTDDTPVTPDNSNQKGAPPQKYYLIQLAWSEYKQDKWTPKKVSKAEDALRSPSAVLPLSRQMHAFKAIVDGDDLVIRCILDVMQSENPQPPSSGPSDTGIPGVGRRDFDNQPTTPVYTYSTQVGEFRLRGCAGTVVPRNFQPDSYWLLTPQDTSIDGMTFAEVANVDRQAEQGTDTSGEEISFDSATDDSFYVVTAPPLFPVLDYPTLTQTTRTVQALAKTPGRFRLLYPHQDLEFLFRNYFFFEDDTRAFLVEYEEDPVLWHRPNQVSPSALGWVREHYYHPWANAPGAPPGPVVPPDGRGPGGPMLFAAPVTAGRVATRRALANVAPLALRPAWLDNVTRILDPGPAKIIVEHPFPVHQKGYRFRTFYHPYVCQFIMQLNGQGIDGLLAPSEGSSLQRQKISKDYFGDTYAPTDAVYPEYPIDDVDFTNGGPYAPYNWELFFHIPLLIATRLSKNQRFEDAQRWFHYIFDPTTGAGDPVPQRFWKIRPFYDTEAGKPIQELLLLLDGTPSPEKDDLIDQVDQWQQRPFDPHLIARLRWTAYEKTVVMKYIENLIAWGDQLFRRDTIETINEATQLYVLAAKILGPRPQELPARNTETMPTVDELLRANLDEFSNILENLIPAPPGVPGMPTVAGSGLGNYLHFCIPPNDKLFGYWDTVADRLFKIRHCMNIEGVVQQLPLFEPPIEPGLLVSAAAYDVDLDSALQPIEAALPQYRFGTMLPKAQELAADVKALGAALFSALEKKDVEALALLRSGQEIQVLTLVRDVKDQQRSEAKATYQGLLNYEDVVQARYDYYSSLPLMNDWEKAHLGLAAASAILQAVSQVMGLGSGTAHLFPEVTVGVAGFAGTPVAVVKFGGGNLGNSLQSYSIAISALASLAGAAGAIAQTVGGYHHRFDDWQFQATLASKELKQVTQQQQAALARVAIAEKELSNHDSQIQNAKDVDEFLRSKHTNAELYDWLGTQVAATYFQTYQQAYDLAKRAERAFQHDLGDPDAGFINFGYWDNLKSGLLAGERLAYDLKRMELAYLERNRREYEITKHLSLALLDPLALVRLRESGECFVRLREEIFDLDYPGHYLRRIRSLGVTIPCVTGPYTAVNCTVSLTWSTYRKSTELKAPPAPYARPVNMDGSYVSDPRFIDQYGTVESIVTSQGQNDPGLFEFNLRDERYLPFEGRGAVSEWRIQLPLETNAIDRATIADVVLHLRYTARDGGAALADKAREALQTALARSGARLFSARFEFSTEWYQFLNPKTDPEEQKLRLDLSLTRFPFQPPNTTSTLNGVQLFLKLKDGFKIEQTDQLHVILSHQDPTGATDAELAADFTAAASFGNLYSARFKAVVFGTWTLTVKTAPPTLQPGAKSHAPPRLAADAVADIAIICSYEVKEV